MSFLYNLAFFMIILFFGIAVSACFASITLNRKNLLSILIFYALEACLQLFIIKVFGAPAVQKLYPLITHLPLILYFVLIHKCTVTHSVVSVLMGFICCQLPRLCSSFIQMFSDNIIIYIVIYLLSSFLIFYIIYRYVSELAHFFMTQTRKNVFLLGIVPFIYYIFFYGGTIYTNWLYSQNEVAVRLLPTVNCLLYLIFIICYHREMTVQEQEKQQAESLNLQLKHAAITLGNMRTIQTQTITYRHDMRHHFTYLQALAATEDWDKIKNYINTIQSDIDTITPKRFCANELINLVLSTYDTKATEKNIALNIQASVPEDLTISDTKLCAILSNALENALYATEKALNTTKNVITDTIQIRLAVRNSILIIQISNPYTGTITYDNNIPSSTMNNHGFGVKSIATLVDSYNGQYEFKSENQTFTIRVLLPLNIKE